MNRLSKILLISILLLSSQLASAVRVKDVADIEGVRSNQLVGYGLVVGLPGTGESSPFTEQSFKTMLTNFGIAMPPGIKPKIKNVAAVAVHADLPAFSKPGQKIDITVSSIGQRAKPQGRHAYSDLYERRRPVTSMPSPRGLWWSAVWAPRALMVPA